MKWPPGSHPNTKQEIPTLGGKPKSDNRYMGKIRLHPMSWALRAHPEGL